MTNYAKPQVRGHAWGETATVNDLVDPGDTYASAGWQIGIKPPRQYVNWVLNYTFAAVRYFCQRGIVDWDGAESYAQGAVVQFGNLLYQAAINNIAAPPNTSPGSWSTINTLTPGSGDNSTHCATTAFCVSYFIAKGGAFSLLGGSINNNQVPVGAVTQWQGSLSIAGSQISSAVASANAILINGGYRAIGWVGQTGQPTWLIGSSDGINFLVWNPSNFSVANAATVGGFAPTAAAAANTAMLRDANGYSYAQYFNQASPNNEPTTINQVVTTQGTDGFFRKSSLAQLKAAMGTFNLSDFPSGNNWFKLPNGKIVQFGQVSVSGTTSFNFAVTFPTVCQSVVITNINSTNQIFVSAQNVNGATFTNGTAVVNYEAIGF